MSTSLPPLPPPTPKTLKDLPHAIDSLAHAAWRLAEGDPTAWRARTMSVPQAGAQLLLWGRLPHAHGSRAEPHAGRPGRVPQPAASEILARHGDLRSPLEFGLLSARLKWNWQTFAAHETKRMEFASILVGPGAQVIHDGQPALIPPPSTLYVPALREAPTEAPTSGDALLDYCRAAWQAAAWASTRGPESTADARNRARRQAKAWAVHSRALETAAIEHVSPFVEWVNVVLSDVLHASPVPHRKALSWQ